MIEAELHAIATELDPAFTVAGLDTQTAPFVFNSPHSGSVYPRAFVEASRLSRRALRKSEDAYVNELFDCAPGLGAVLMQAHFPRAYLDVNREPYELDPALILGKLPDYANTHSVRVVGGLGVIARIVNEHEEIYRAPLSLDAALARIRLIYKPYHAALSEVLEKTRAAFGVSCLIDCHSMPSHPPGPSGQPKVDFVLGDRFGASCSSNLTRYIEATLKAWGFTVALNKPYAGGFITEEYGKPASGAHALQIEINRALYMDETTMEKRGSFPVIRDKLAVLAARLGEHADDLLQPARKAAE
ncbi:MAG: N-formylglutamate amidohydrolase [Hyphomicrobiales bacterium]|nr:N-formylglutamate amidohydrolase [Hyphomicrobiales bacterium]